MSAAKLPSEDRPQEDAMTLPDGFRQEPKAEPSGRARRALAASVDLDPNSLSGSYFSAKHHGWGIVAAEVQPGKYLVQIDGERGQRPFTLDRMIEEGWTFYDTEEDRTLAYAEYLAEQEA